MSLEINHELDALAYNDSLSYEKCADSINCLECKELATCKTVGYGSIFREYDIEWIDKLMSKHGPEGAYLLSRALEKMCHEDFNCIGERNPLNL